MVPDADPPTFIFHGIVNASLAGVTLGFHCISTQGASSCGTVARPHKDGVSSMTDMVGPSIRSALRGTRPRTGRCWYTESSRSESLSRSLDRDHRKSKGQPQKATYGPAQRMAGKPYVGVWIERCNIAVQINSCSIISIFVFQVFDQARSIAGVCG